jgi:alpha-amylase
MNTNKTYFLFGVHNHQPVGNFDFVFEEAYQKAYLPFLELVAQRPWFRFTLHNSGCLWEWLAGHHPEYLTLVKQLSDRGQVELWGGGFYEPILPAIPERDRRGQLAMMSDFLEQHFGARPQGAWVAERVWEPSLPSTLTQAGIGWTALDDAHFKAAGLFDQDLNGYFLTDDQGCSLKVFPISQKLRYLIPFHDVEEVIGHLLNEHRPGQLAILADDGEKFGVWPGTHQHVFAKGWLIRFLEALEANRERIETITFAQAAEKILPRGRIYLPTGSYTEMGEWVLQPEAEAVYRELVDRLKREGNYDRYAPFVRGGIWKNFFAKYPESNFIYRKMLEVSSMVAQSGPEVRRELYRGQCNCGYWHGIFGGLYLPHLRSALYRHLIRAENLALNQAGCRSMERRDFDGDGRTEVKLSNRMMSLYLKPDWGGAIYEWDLKEKETNLLDNLSRRPESYHRHIKEHRTGEESGKSIHEMMAAKEEGLENLLTYDPCPRMALMDHLLEPEACLESLRGSRLPAYQGVLETGWEESELGDNKVPGVGMKGIHKNIVIEKTVRLAAYGVLRADYRWTNKGREPVELRPGIEFNLGLLSAGEGRYCKSTKPLSTDRLDRAAEDGDIQYLEVHDDFRGLRVEFRLDRAWDLWRYPVETVSQSESGLERNYQCSCLVWSRLIRLEPGQTETLEISVEVKP